MEENFSYVVKQIQPKGKLVYEYNPLHNFRTANSDGELKDFDTSKLNFDLSHPVTIDCQESYDKSINLILNDGTNIPRIINTRFTARENNTYERVDRLGNTDTNIYDEDEFTIDTSLVKRYINIPEVTFKGVAYGGGLPVGNYTFYFKLSDADDNETDIVAESGLVTIHIGALNSPPSIRGGEQNENSGKMVQFQLSNLDSGYDYVKVYYSRTTGVDNATRTTTAARVNNRFRIKNNYCLVSITGNESVDDIPVSELSQDFFLASSAKAQAICQNMLFLGNVSKATADQDLINLSLNWLPYYESETPSDITDDLGVSYSDHTGYYNTNNIYNKVGYWNEEIYRFGVVYIMDNGSLSPVFNIRGINGVPEINEEDSYTKLDNDFNIDYDTQLINSGTLENSAGVCRIVDTSGGQYFKVRHFKFKIKSEYLEKIQDKGVKGYFFVRQKRIPLILCQAFMIGRDTYSGIPAWTLENTHVTETFLDSQGYLTQNYEERLIQVNDNKYSVSVGFAPEYELNQPYYNNFFTGDKMIIRQETAKGSLLAASNHIYQLDNTSYTWENNSTMQAKVISIPDGTNVTDGSTKFKGVAGAAEELKFTYVNNKTNKPIKKNFSGTKTTYTFLNGHIQVNTKETTSKVAITRGLYGTYLGVYNNNLIHDNSLINIYIPGYGTENISEYFNIRINCEDQYYAVSDRKTLKLGNDIIEDVYRGDCFISQFTHRINRNFQDPDAPCNDTIVEASTWRNNYDADKGTASDVNRGDVNAIQMGTYITFRCYTTYNVAMRDWDRGYPSEESLTGCKRSFYPLSPIRVDGHYKIPESNQFNQGFSATTGEKAHFLQPNVPYIKNTYQTRIIYSDIAQTDAFKNGFRIFKGVSFRDYSNQYGGITKLVQWLDNLVVIFEHGIGIATVNANVLIPTDDGTSISVGAVKVIPDTLKMLSTDYGTQWSESVVCSNAYIYGVDTVARKIWRTQGSGVECISDFHVQKFLNENISLGERELTPLIGVRNVKSHFNNYKNDVMFTFYDNTYGFEETVWNLCYCETLSSFTTFYSWLPSYSANIDNVFFTFDRNCSKWVSKLAASTCTKTVDEKGKTAIVYNNDASGVCLDSVQINGSSWSANLYLSPDRTELLDQDKQYTLEFTLERDNFGNYAYFEIVNSTLKVTDYPGLLKHWFLAADESKVKTPSEPCIGLNIKCTIKKPGSNNNSIIDHYTSTNEGYYSNQIFLTLKDIVNNQSSKKELANGSVAITVQNQLKLNDITVNLPTFETAFWKHGFAGIIDTQEKIMPCLWYHKQHPFEFEFVTGNDNAGYKQFDNLVISSNNVAPESFHYTIVGDSYDFSDQKPSMYWRQEATKYFYQYNGCDILYDHKVFDTPTKYEPSQVTSSTYIEKTNDNTSYLRHSSTVSNVYRDTMMPWIYTRQDTFNEIEDYYKSITASAYKDYPNITGGEIVWDCQFNHFSICNHVKARDVKNVGRTRANMQYINDKWVIQITPINVYNRNYTWFKDSANNLHPKLVINNIPTEVFNHLEGTIDKDNIPSDLEAYRTDPSVAFDMTPWESIANARKEIKLMDKQIKTKIRYKGDQLVNILAVSTQFNSMV